MARTKTRALSADRQQAPIGIRYAFPTDEPVPLKNARNADPQQIGEALDKIARENDGHLTPAAAVDAARDPGNPLHPHFEWDDRVAAEAYRIDQARALIRIVRVVDDTRGEVQRAFLSIASARGGVSYRTSAAVLASAQLQEIVLRQAQRDLEAFEKRYKELEDICELVGEARQRLSDRLSRTAAETESRV